MIRTSVIFSLAFLFLRVSGGEKPIEATFLKADLGTLPKPWKAAKTGEGTGGIWKVLADETAPSKSGHALAQTADGPKPLFNVCVLDGSSFRDGEISVGVKAVSGKIDQGGGVVWRYKDASNYYVCRYNPLEANLRAYHVKDGVRTQLATKEELELPAGQWFTVSVKQSGRAMACSLNGKLHLEVADETFPDAGMVGVWSKADAVSHFDAFRAAPAGK